MLKPAVDSVIKGSDSRYSLVIAVAKRAREIAEEAELNGDILIDKPVSMAVNELEDNKYHIVESKELQRLKHQEQ